MRTVQWDARGQWAREVASVVSNHFELYAETAKIGVLVTCPQGLSREANERSMPHHVLDGHVIFTRAVA